MSKRPDKCGWCSRPHILLCDWKVGKGTCDSKMCDKHGTAVAENKHLCPTHKKAYAEWQARRASGGTIAG